MVVFHPVNSQSNTHTKSSPAGRWVKTLEGYRAFHPKVLPPAIEWTETLAVALANASTMVGKLAGEGRRLPNPHVLIRPFIRREAVFSSRIEGTQSTLGELLASEAGAAVERSPEDLREVGNYVVALEYGIERLKTLPLSLRLVRELHEKLMTGVRGNTQLPVNSAAHRIGLALRVPPSRKRRMSLLRLALWVSISRRGKSSFMTRCYRHSFTLRWRTTSSKRFILSSMATAA